MTKPLLDVLNRQRRSPPPIWLMRQAGRYLPEYRKLREKAGDFFKLCFTPEFAAEATLQPIRRFGFDAAILFSDILVVPYALGQSVQFTLNEGPQLDAIADRRGVIRLKTELDHGVLTAIYETIERVKEDLPPGVSLLGFCGAPWTVATYMTAGSGTSEQEPARRFAYQDPQGFSDLIEKLIEASASYLVRQLEAGVDAVQIFDTWAGVLPAEEFHRWCIEPIQRIIAKVRHQVANAKLIGFPRGAGTTLLRYVEGVPVDAISLDWTVDPVFVREHVAMDVPVQGNLDPLVLLAGGAALDHSVEAILKAFSGRPFIFNLGHGVLPQTPIAHVEQMLARVRAVEAR